MLGARAVDDGRNKRRDDRHRDNPEQDMEDDVMTEGMTEDATGTSPEIPEHLRIITGIHKIMSSIKASMFARQTIHDKLGQLAALFTSVQEENTRLKAENRILREVKLQKSYASVTQTAAVAPRQLPQVIQKQKEDRNHTVFVSSAGKEAKEVQKLLTSNVNPIKDKIRIRSMRTVNKLVIVETSSREDIDKLQGHKTLEQVKISVELPRKRNPLDYIL